MFHFPDAKQIQECVYSHPILAKEYYLEKGVTKAIAELAAERFTNGYRTELGLKTGVMFMINHLEAGKDGFSGKLLPTFEYSLIDWNQIAMCVERVLIESANKKN
ncbi:MAG: hypothetical protein S4CHLAM123_03790 [Chlamydiales bacterium]|nr:hypothetical protein [Chlamydiales bacterium]